MSETMGITKAIGFTFSDDRASVLGKGNLHSCDIKKIMQIGGDKMHQKLTKNMEESSKVFEMTTEQSKWEVQYKMSQKILKVLLQMGIVNEEELKKIDYLNRESFSPQLAKVYV